MLTRVSEAGQGVHDARGTVFVNEVGEHLLVLVSQRLGTVVLLAAERKHFGAAGSNATKSKDISAGVAGVDTVSSEKSDQR